MDFSFTPEQQTWRKEVRHFMNTELPADYNGGDGSAPSPFTVEEDNRFLAKLAERKWLVMNWPEEHGGGGAGVIEQLIFHEELGYRRGPNLGPGVLFVGPSLIIHGTEEQKARFLPQISAGKLRWCQGFSEPGTGSDLASLQTRAVQDGDDFVVNGSKIWTTMAHHSQYCWLAVRTDPDAPKHKGITLLMVDMKTPGITIRPVPNMAGYHSFNQVFFDDVRVPRANMVGPMNRGWYVITTTLDFERSVITSAAQVRKYTEELIAYAKDTIGPDGKPIASDPAISGKLANLMVDAEMARMFAYQVASVQLHGRVPNREASICKLFSSELTQKLGVVGMAVLGPNAARPHIEGRWADLHERIVHKYLGSYAASIASGSSEIQRNIIATRGLGMPR